jgi:hypothetical protein
MSRARGFCANDNWAVKSSAIKQAVFDALINMGWRLVF